MPGRSLRPRRRYTRAHAAPAIVTQITIAVIWTIGPSSGVPAKGRRGECPSDVHSPAEVAPRGRRGSRRR